MTSTPSASPSKAPRLPGKASVLDKILEFGNAYSGLGVVGGIVAGVWAGQHHSVLKQESSILLAMAGGDVALLAIILAAVALMSGLLEGRFGNVIKTAVGLDLFYFPFQVVTCVTAAGALASFAGAIHADWGSKTLRAALFGLSVGLTTWAILGTVLLTFTFIQYSVRQQQEKGKG